MLVLSVRSFLLLLCTTSTFLVLGRAPGAVNLRTRDIESAISIEGKSGRDKRTPVTWPLDRVW